MFTVLHGTVDQSFLKSDMETVRTCNNTSSMQRDEAILRVNFQEYDTISINGVNNKPWNVNRTFQLFQIIRITLITTLFLLNQSPNFIFDAPASLFQWHLPAIHLQRVWCFDVLTIDMA